MLFSITDHRRDMEIARPIFHLNESLHPTSFHSRIGIKKNEIRAPVTLK